MFRQAFFSKDSFAAVLERSDWRLNELYLSQTQQLRLPIHFPISSPEFVPAVR